ncbi:uncharacterized protein L3040_009572 [Drepanopeziza brunnea f. sp. 'multigermtubi']|uniref:uncharacterized protein n=1 Tax=Drepanopeziza brunnea f. sp. 'multigermtubi' TaxID=698441 RepID=UPI00239FF49A|nr:hypothetical protein L3040_009572 [Drepanopeziza brunnea f. sp. 'multigermtubi']
MYFSLFSGLEVGKPCWLLYSIFQHLTTRVATLLRPPQVLQSAFENNGQLYGAVIVQLLRPEIWCDEGILEARKRDSWRWDVSVGDEIRSTGS